MHNSKVAERLFLRWAGATESDAHLSGAFGPWLDTLVRAGKIPAGQGNPWEQARKNRIVRELCFLSALKRLDELFAGKKIEAIVLKGPALAYRYYEDPLHRAYSDIDILVGPNDWMMAQELLVRGGGKAELEGSWKGTKFRRVIQFDLCTIELHCRLLVDRPPPEASDPSKRTRPVKIPGIFWLRELGAETNFVYLCGHGVFQHLFDELHWLIDLDLIVRNEESSLDWGEIIILSKKMRMQKSLVTALSILRKHFETPIPDLDLRSLRGNIFHKRFMPAYLTPERILEHKHLSPRMFCLFLKAMLRDSPLESLRYGLGRTF